MFVNVLIRRGRRGTGVGVGLYALPDPRVSLLDSVLRGPLGQSPNPSDWSPTPRVVTCCSSLPVSSRGAPNQPLPLLLTGDGTVETYTARGRGLRESRKPGPTSLSSTLLRNMEIGRNFRTEGGEVSPFDSGFGEESRERVGVCTRTTVLTLDEWGFRIYRLPWDSCNYLYLPARDLRRPAQVHPPLRTGPDGVPGGGGSRREQGRGPPVLGHQPTYRRGERGFLRPPRTRPSRAGSGVETKTASLLPLSGVISPSTLHGWRGTGRSPTVLARARRSILGGTIDRRLDTLSPRRLTNHGVRS